MPVTPEPGSVRCYYTWSPWCEGVVITPRACRAGAVFCMVLLYIEPVVWCVVVTPRACHLGAGFCKVLLYIEPVVWGCSGYATCLSRRSRGM